MLTAYEYYTAKTYDEAGIDILLVGDTLGMAFGGHDTTLPVRMEQIIYHSEIVSRAVTRSMIVGDMPFLTYQLTVDKAVENAGRLMQDGKVEAVKLEGGRTMIPVIKGILRAGIPVMGHLGLTPQSVHKFGGWKIQGRDDQAAANLREAAKALEDAGCFSVVLEAIPAELSKEVTESLEIPTIGIGAGPNCDGQVLVSSDMLGLTKFNASYLKQYCNLQDIISEAVKKYISEVKTVEYPGEEHSY